MTHTLTLTDDQAEILGYALTLALRLRRADAETARSRLKMKPQNPARESAIAATASDQAARIEEVRCLLDCCPVKEG